MANINEKTYSKLVLSMISYFVSSSGQELELDEIKTIVDTTKNYLEKLGVNNKHFNSEELAHFSMLLEMYLLGVAIDDEGEITISETENNFDAFNKDFKYIFKKVFEK